MPGRHRSTHSLWWREMGNVPLPHSSSEHRLQKIHFDFCSFVWEHSLFSSFNPIMFSFKLLVPFIWSHEGVCIGTMFGSVTFPFSPLVEGPWVHHHVASPWPTLSRWRGQQGPQEARSLLLGKILWLQCTQWNCMVTYNMNCFLRFRAMRL